MHKFLQRVYIQARKNPQRIVFTEGIQPRTLQALEEILEKKIAIPILLGDQKIIKNTAKKLKLKIDWKKVQIEDPKKSKHLNHFAKSLYEMRKNKGMTLNLAKKLVKDINYFGTIMVELDLAGGMVTGMTCPTHESVLPALQIIKTKEKFHKVSGVFFMVMEKRLLLFADTAITVTPEAHDLVDIAIDTAETAKKFGLTPKIAMLSFSTKGSADHPLVDRVKQAVAMLKDERPDLIADGDLQVDAALVPEVAKIKCPTSPIAGNANVLIFPDLGAANIAYKLVERLAKAKAIGPILQGLKKPINDLSRGCSYKDIVDITAFTVCEVEAK